VKKVVGVGGRERGRKSIANENSNYSSRHGREKKGRERTANLDGSLELEEDWLGDEDLACLCAQVFDLKFLQLDLFSWPVSSH
jgi:hypothetical protein